MASLDRSLKNFEMSIRANPRAKQRDVVNHIFACVVRDPTERFVEQRLNSIVRRSDGEMHDSMEVIQYNLEQDSLSLGLGSFEVFPHWVGHVGATA